MKATVLVDNIAVKPLKGEWGLSIIIEAEERKILLDVGASPLFLENADKLNIDISSIEHAVLSHAHYDHANGMEAFFQANSKALFHLRDGSDENCYMKWGIFHKYIGIPRKILQKYAHRIQYVNGNYKLMENTYLVPHYTDNLEQIGKRNHMYVRRNHVWYPDDFSHEQSLVFDRPDGLVIFNCCSHGGADNIIQEVSEQFHKPVKMMVGGFHIYNCKKEEVVALSHRLQKTGVSQIYTGHCTGEDPYEVLRTELGDRVHQLKTGLTIEF